MKVRALKDFEFYILPNVVKFKNGQIISSTEITQQSINYMLALKFVEPADVVIAARKVESAPLENKLVSKNFKANKVQENKLSKEEFKKQILEKHGIELRGE